MIYEIISKNDVPTSQMHIYLKNKTGNDGDIYPEIFNDLALTESVNGLYAFAIACVITDNFTNMARFLKDYPSKEVATLALVQYIKGVATSVQLNSQCVNPLYNHLSEINLLGTSPTLLNLDGDLFYKHYNTDKYYSKEAADAAEDSFPYWVINTVKEIISCTEIVNPSIKTFELPYYIQNISDEYIPILNKLGSKFTDEPIIPEEFVIGMIPPSGKEPVIDIVDGYAVLGTSETAYILLTDKVRPIKHVVELSELNIDNGSLKLPDGEFDVVCKPYISIYSMYGIKGNYNSSSVCYHPDDVIHIKKLFHNAGVTDDGLYIHLHSDYVYIKNPSEEHTNLDDVLSNPDTVVDVQPADIATPFFNCAYLVIIPMPSEDVAHNAIKNILKKSPYKDAYIDVDLDDKFTIVVHGDNDTGNAIKVKKKILAVFGYKAMVIEYNKFYK